MYVSLLSLYSVNCSLQAPYHRTTSIIVSLISTLLHTTPHYTPGLVKYATYLSHHPTAIHVQSSTFTHTDQLTSMGSLLSIVKQKTSSPTIAKTTTSSMAPSHPETFKHYANAQTEFTKTLPLIGNENAFLGDIFSSYVLLPIRYSRNSTLPPIIKKPLANSTPSSQRPQRQPHLLRLLPP